MGILVTAVSGILFLGYAKVGSRHDLRLAEAAAPPFLLPRTAQPGQDDAPREPVGSRRGRPWWEH